MTEENLPWWKKTVFYHIYPMSFYDSNNDGIGDIQGITDKLNYLKDLGIGGIWLGPIYESPLEYDFGYGPANLRNINTLFGNMDQFEKLVDAAHALDIKVVLEWAAANTSIYSSWFKESRQSRDNSKSDWYFWSDTIPNNWVSYSGGSAWHYCPERNQYYLGMFFKEHAELNWRNVSLQKELLGIFEFWLSKGIDGFRLDAIEMYLKDEKLRDNPPRKPNLSELLGADDPILNSRYLTFLLPEWLFQEPLYDRAQPGISEIIKQMRSLCNKYRENAFLLGEVHLNSDTREGLCNSGMNASFNFPLMFAPWSAEQFHGQLASQIQEIDNFQLCTVFSNHDNPRAVKRYEGKTRSETEQRMKIIALLTMTIKGIPMVYYGEEIGLCDVDLNYSELRDPISRAQFVFNRNREASRGPMRWDRSANGGFSKKNPWLRTSSELEEINFKDQSVDPKSLFSLYKKVIELRNKNAILQTGNFELMPLISSDILAYRRYDQSDNYIIIINFSEKKKTACLSDLGFSAESDWSFLLQQEIEISGKKINFGAYGFGILSCGQKLL